MAAVEQFNCCRIKLIYSFFCVVLVVMAAKVVSLVVRGCTGKLNINIQQEITVKVSIKLFD